MGVGLNHWASAVYVLAVIAMTGCTAHQEI